jgi:hypothetical protein
MQPQESLEKVSFQLDVPRGSRWCRPEATDSGFSFLKQVRNVPQLGAVFDRVAQGGKIAVDFDVPAAIKAGLESGEYIRKGGVIVTSKGHRVFKWLEEGKVVRVGQAVNVLTVFVNVWSDYVLNEKLKQIQEQLTKIEDYVEAEHYAPLLNAHVSLKAALTAQIEANRTQHFFHAQHSFMTARNKTRILLNKKVPRLHQELKEFENAYFDNESELGRIYDLLDEMTTMAGTITHCYKAEARIFENLNDFPNAERSRVEGLNFQLDFCEYAGSLVRGESSYLGSGLVKELKIAPKELHVSGRMKPLHRRLKTVASGLKDIGEAIQFKKNLDEMEPAHMPKPLAKRWNYLHERLSELEKRVVCRTFELCEIQTPGKAAPLMVGPGPSRKDLILFGGKDGLFAVEITTGEPVECFKTSTAVVTQPLVSGSTVLFGCHGGKLHAIDIETWTERWSLQTGVNTWYGFTLGDGVVCLNLNDNCLCSLSLDSGKMNWEFHSQGRIQAAPAISNGTVYFGTLDGKVFALDLQTGQQKWAYDKKDWRCGHVAVWQRS